MLHPCDFPRSDLDMADDSCSGQIDANLSQKILDEVVVGFEDQLRFTMDLMRYPSLRGQEHTAQNFFYDALEARGYETVSYTHLTLPPICSV